MHNEIKGHELPTVAALSYLGDAGHSLYVRRMLVGRGISKAKELNAAALKYITAQAQSKLLGRIEDKLLPDERDVLRRASNSTHLNKPKNAKTSDYRRATGFAAVIGMLIWINDDERLKELLDLAHREDTDNDTEN